MQYVRDIRACLQVQEEQAVPATFMQGAQKMAERKAVLLKWMKQVHAHCHLSQETWLLSVAILDNFIRVQTVFFCFQNLFDWFF